ncbi:MAG: ABC transporter permease [Alphaproteobacteria bacterium]|nr:ABC transporter permease [Alphaproteobacteria bacterium]
MLFDPALLDSLPRFFTPILLASLGGALCQRAGVFNIALEGLMLIGAFAAMAGSFAFQSWETGLAAAALAGALGGLVFAWFAVWREGDDIVVSIGLNILALGATAYLLRSLFGARGTFDDPAITALPVVNLPLIDNIPLLGGLMNGQSILVWFSVLLVPLLALMLNRHVWGLRLRAAGENPVALEAAGVSPLMVRTKALVICGALAGLAGAQLSISNVTLFTEGMSSGRGWIAVVIVLMCMGRVWLILLTSVVFGFIDALGFRIQGLGMPQQFTDALPYVLALVVLAIAYRRRRTQQGS